MKTSPGIWRQSRPPASGGRRLTQEVAALAACVRIRRGAPVASCGSEAARRLAKAVESELASLAMEKTRVEIQGLAAEWSATRGGCGGDPDLAQRRRRVEAARKDRVGRRVVARGAGAQDLRCSGACRKEGDSAHAGLRRSGRGRGRQRRGSRRPAAEEACGSRRRCCA